jgi:hypothetical protein
MRPGVIDRRKLITRALAFLGSVAFAGGQGVSTSANDIA